MFCASGLSKISARLCSLMWPSVICPLWSRQQATTRPSCRIATCVSSARHVPATISLPILSSLTPSASDSKARSCQQVNLLSRLSHYAIFKAWLTYFSSLSASQDLRSAVFILKRILSVLRKRIRTSRKNTSVSGTTCQPDYGTAT